jgi:hypothetical protein
VELTFWLPKLSDVGESTASGVAALTPVPVRVTVCGEPVALSATDIAAAKLATDAGVNVTEIEHVADAASVIPQVFAEIAKSVGFVPVRVIELMVNAALPVFVSVVDIALAVVLTVVFGKASMVGENDAPGAVPVPVSVTVCGLPVALSVTEIAALKLAAEAGVKVTEIVQVAVTASVIPQVLAEIVKSVGFVPVSVMLLMVSGALPELVRTVDIAVAVLLTGVLGKASVVGESEATGAIPVPLSVTVCGEPVALSATEIAAVKLAAERGVKVAEIVQVADAASVFPQVLAEIAKSAVFVPVSVMPVMVNDAVPLFVSVVDIAVAVLFTSVFGKLMLVGERDAPGAAAGVPVPVSTTVCGEPVALSATLSVAEKLVAEAGVKVTEMLQLAFTASDVPHALV